MTPGAQVSFLQLVIINYTYSKLPALLAAEVVVAAADAVVGLPGLQPAVGGSGHVRQLRRWPETREVQEREGCHKHPGSAEKETTVTSGHFLSPISP